MGVATGDFNGDGHADFACIEYGAQRLDIYLNNGDGTFSAPTPYADVTVGGPRSILARDFNNDGILDLMMDIEDTPSLGLYFGNGDGTFRIRPPSTHRSAAMDPSRPPTLISMAISILW